jgi:hypothetical protein
MLTQQVELDSENLGIGIVTQAAYIRETLSKLDGAPAAPPASPAASGARTIAGAVAADTVAIGR